MPLQWVREKSTGKVAQVYSTDAKEMCATDEYEFFNPNDDETQVGVPNIRDETLVLPDRRPFDELRPPNPIPTAADSGDVATRVVSDDQMSKDGRKRAAKVREEVDKQTYEAGEAVGKAMDAARKVTHPEEGMKPGVHPNAESKKPAQKAEEDAKKSDVTHRSDVKSGNA